MPVEPIAGFQGVVEAYIDTAKEAVERKCRKPAPLF
jgi:hypothetical protein